jgi:hypothetical protein
MGFQQARNWRENSPSIESSTTITKPNEIRFHVPFLPPGWWGKSDGSFEGFDSIDDKIDDSDFFMMEIKFGFGRSTRMASRLIQNGHMTREQGLELVRLYDGEFPNSYLPDVLEYLDMDETEFRRIVDLHRNPEIWEEKDGQWALRYPPR